MSNDEQGMLKDEGRAIAAISHEEWFEMKQVLKVLSAVFEEESGFRTYPSPDPKNGFSEA